MGFQDWLSPGQIANVVWFITTEATTYWKVSTFPPRHEVWCISPRKRLKRRQLNIFETQIVVRFLWVYSPDRLTEWKRNSILSLLHWPYNSTEKMQLIIAIYHIPSYYVKKIDWLEHVKTLQQASYFSPKQVFLYLKKQRVPMVKPLFCR